MVNGDDATFKRVRISPDGLTLQPLNPSFDPIHFTCDHASNYVPLNGTLRQDSEKFIGIINDALSGKVEKKPEQYRGF